MSLEITVHTHEDIPQTYKKKPVEVMAVKWTGSNFDTIKEFAGENVALDGDELIIKTLEDGSKGQAKHAATIGDFVIRGVAGEFYFCKPKIFNYKCSRTRRSPIISQIPTRGWEFEMECLATF